MSSIALRLRARAGLFAVSGGALLWGTTGVAVRIIHDRSGLGAVPIGCLRLAISAVALVIVFGRAGVRRARAALERHRWALLVSGAGLGVYQALYFLGVQYVGVSISTLVSLAVAPVVITLGLAAARRAMPNPIALTTLGAAIAGLVLISLHPGGSGGSHPLWGVLASVGSGLGYAGTTLLNRRLVADGDPLLLTATTSLIGAVVLVPFAAATLSWPHDGVSSFWLVYIGIVPTAIAYWLFYAGLRTTPTETAGVLTLLEPLTAAVLAAIVLHETLSTAGRLGAVLMLLAIGGLYVRAPEDVPGPETEPPAL